MCRAQDRLKKMRDVAFELLAENTVISETLFYTLVDSLGMDADDAAAVVKKVHPPRSHSAYGISQAIENATVYGISPRQVPPFMKKYAKHSSRIKTIRSNNSNLCWVMNGYETLEPPFIAGFSRENLSALCDEKIILEQKIKRLNKLILECEDSQPIENLSKTKQQLSTRLEVVKERIRLKLHN